MSTSIEDIAKTSADGFNESTSGQAAQAAPTAVILVAARVIKSLLVVLPGSSGKISSDISYLKFKLDW
jgi:hypothetical protein